MNVWKHSLHRLYEALQNPHVLLMSYAYIVLFQLFHFIYISNVRLLQTACFWQIHEICDTNLVELLLYIILQPV
jgi:hypothetical protein